MPRPRKSLISLDVTPYYHCVSRCVRRAFLCGQDIVSGNSYEHRRGWIQEHLLHLASIFAIDVAAYALMSNHYHLVLHIDQAKADAWTDYQVVERWHQLFRGTNLSQRFVQGERLSNVEWIALEPLITQWRERLTSISWLMRCLNEPIARRANREDHTTGRFWEGRFKSQALLDEAALAACLAYVDLNPIRAKMAQTPETSTHTSVQQRIQHAKGAHSPNIPTEQPSGLLPFAGNPRAEMPKGLPFNLTDYLQLVDWTGRQLREDKRGAISKTLPEIMLRLQLDQKHWLYLTQHFESPFRQIIGQAHHVRQACEALGQHWAQGVRQCERLFSSG